jgi:hypothetical protein
MPARLGLVAHKKAPAELGGGEGRFDLRGWSAPLSTPNVTDPAITLNIPNDIFDGPDDLDGAVPAQAGPARPIAVMNTIVTAFDLCSPDPRD